MRNVMMGALVVAGLWAAAAPWSVGRDAAVAGPIQAGEARGNELIAWSSPVGDKQLLSVLDQRTRALAVYHVENASGKVTLMSVRRLEWDLQMVQYNGVVPLPGELRQMAQQ